MSVTHLAGPFLLINDRLIQRCCICGQKLMDQVVKDMNAESVKPPFVPMCFVQSDGINLVPTLAPVEDNQPEFPKDSCIDFLDLEEM